MPIKITAYTCKHGCGKYYKSKPWTKKHEEKCIFNPYFAACISCDNNKQEYETIYNPYHNGNPGSTDYERPFRYCDITREILIDIDGKLNLMKNCGLYRQRVTN